jgi:hypothetical protein
MISGEDLLGKKTMVVSAAAAYLNNPMQLIATKPGSH